MPKVKADKDEEYCDECCRYREKLAKEKRRDEGKSRNATRNVTSGCCNGKRDSSGNEIDSSTCGHVEKKSRRIKKSSKKTEVSECLNQALARIKPSFDDRKKYADVNHILCILDDAELVSVKKVKELRKAMEKSEVCDEKSFGSEDQKRRKEETGTSQEGEAGKEVSNDEKEEGEASQKKDKDTVDEEKSKRVSKDGKTEKKTVTVKVAKGEPECESICSVDSEVDVGEFALTGDEISEIEKNHRQPEKEDDKSQMETEEKKTDVQDTE